MLVMINPVSNQLPQAQIPSSHVLGDGGAAVVVANTDPMTGSPIATKIFNDSRYAGSEVEALKAARAVLHMMQWRRIYNDTQTNKRCLDLDLIEAKNVFEAYLRRGCPRLELDEIKSLACQLFEFCDGMEKTGYIHGDLSPDNLIWERICRKLTVIDLGASYKIGTVPKFVTTTSFRYAPPELILKKEATSSYDLWSVGCVLFELITGKALCNYGDLPNLKENYLYILQQTVTQIGTPSPEFLKQCKLADECFDSESNMELINEWEIPETPFWGDAVRQSLAEKNVDSNEIDQWIALLGRLLSYENRGSASEHLASPLFSGEVKVELVFNRDVRCKIGICRASTHSEDPERLDMLIDLNKQKDHRCVHIPRDPNNLYEIFVMDDTNEVHNQVAIQSPSLDITELQAQLVEEPESSSISEDAQ